MSEIGARDEPLAKEVDKKVQEKAEEAKAKLQDASVFAKADRDHNGWIDPKELQDFLKSKKINVSDEENEIIFSRYDTNSDHKIDRKEFLAMMGTMGTMTAKATVYGFASHAGCLFCLNTFAYSCCLCTLGLSFIPFCCYKKKVTKEIQVNVKDMLLEGGKPKLEEGRKEADEL
uniref:EF-hand domain-containing protein n=1 Tax=Lotharella globosa TaxID=91324 RepID=A0A7S4DGI7_9EUKA|mmetsp:Transcript_6026/g.10948  ORF Transcript_6026/g.10948 Transcript_6026/m.10948 type:complete len:174 (+) Transcript_6026:55-576(+)